MKGVKGYGCTLPSSFDRVWAYVFSFCAAEAFHTLHRVGGADP